MIGTKDSEIEYLKKIINKSNIGQFDGETYDDDPSDFLATDENENNVNDSDASSDESTTFGCELCDFQTENRRGLKIHVGRKHQVSCNDCGINFNDNESFIRHNEGKSTLKNIEPCESPDNEMKIDTKEPDEACLAIYDKTANTVICLLHSHECWSRLAHSCDDLPSQEEDLEDINTDILHQAIGSVVMGELSKMGCFMDWSSFAASIAQQKTTQLA